MLLPDTANCGQSVRRFMAAFAAVSALSGPILLAAPAAAQSPSDEPPEITLLDPPQGEGAAAYESLAQLSLVQSELNYVDTLKGEIPMDGAPRYTPPEEEEAIPEARQIEFNPYVAALLVAVMALLAFLLWKFGGPARGMFAGQPKEGARNQSDTAEPMAVLTGLDVFRAMKDREAALVQLVQEALQRAAEANRLRLPRSETARETLRRVPRSWPLHPNLRKIVMAEELVQFGGRPLSEEVFDACLENAAPIWRAAA